MPSAQDDRRTDPWARRGLLVASGLAGLFALNALGLLGHGAVHTTIGTWGNVVVGLLAAAICLLRVRAAHDRLAWLLIGAGISSWAIGNAAFSLVYGNTPDDAIPAMTFADALWTAFYPLTYAGILLLARRRRLRLGVGLWLDGWIVGLAAAALVGTLVVPRVVDATGGLALTANFGYLVGDLVLCLLAVGIVVADAPRGVRGLAAAALAPIAFAISDGLYFVESAYGTYEVGGLLDLGWLVGLLLAAFVATVAGLPAPARTAARPRIDATAAVPTAAGMLALGLLAVAQLDDVPPYAIALALGALLLTLVRTGLTLHENRGAVALLHREARTDALTGLGNRRRLFADLARACGGRDREIALVVFDLDGFKTYNDTFGHAAGDQLLQRLAGRLRDGIAGRGRGYRLGGDEFCALVDPAPADPEALCRELSAHMAQRGSGFLVTVAHGCSLAPHDGTVPGELLRRADRRMYEEKHRRRPSAATQAVDALLATVQERHPTLASHVDGVTALARTVAERLGLADEDLDAVAHAAALHDVGKVAIPDAILRREAPLDEAEWGFMRRHTLIGERILLAVPALRAAAPLVRASHERWDGGGYPDGLRGDEIPLGAAIIAACDAFDAMTEDRPYQAARSPQEALDELRRCSGTQFDPRVVAELEAVVRDRRVRCVTEGRSTATGAPAER